MTTSDRRGDLVAGRFDAGIHFGEFLEQDMIAVRVSRDHRPAIVGSPAYFSSHAEPNRRGISRTIAASTSVTEKTASTVGSSTGATSP